MNPKIMSIIVTLTTLLASGCVAIQPPIAIDKNHMTKYVKSVGVYMKAEKPTIKVVGADCILCIGIAAAANSKLKSHLQTLPLSDVESIKKTIASEFKQYGHTVSFVTPSSDISALPEFDKAPGFPKTDFRSLKQELNVDLLVVVEVNVNGAYRTYNGLIPTSDPKGSIVGKIYSVDLRTNKYAQYESIDFKVPVSGEWKEPPNFPGVTSAYYEAIERTKEFIEKLI